MYISIHPEPIPCICNSLLYKLAFFCALAEPSSKLIFGLILVDDNDDKN